VKNGIPPIKPQPWVAADATDAIRRIAKSDAFTLIPTRHALEQMGERGLFTGDVLYVLKHGFVLDDPRESTKSGFYKYKVVSRSPNSGSRTVGVIAIPDAERCEVKIVTVMWID
jgi:hypothetical protein